MAAELSPLREQRDIQFSNFRRASLRNLTKQINPGARALFALAFDLAIPHEPIEPRARLSVISRETAVADIQVLVGMTFKISASVLRALMFWGALLARSNNPAGPSDRDPAFLAIGSTAYPYR